MLALTIVYRSRIHYNDMPFRPNDIRYNNRQISLTSLYLENS